MNETCIFLRSSNSEKNISLLIATDEEVESYVAQQDRNKFVAADNKSFYERLGKAEVLLKNVLAVSNSRNIESLSITEGADCSRLNFANLCNICFRVLSIHNKEFIDNDNLPFFSCPEEVILGRSITNTIDLEKYPNLKRITILEWNKKLRLTGKNNIYKLVVHGFNPTTNDKFEQFNTLIDNLTELIINRSSCTNLQGLEKYESLNKLEINYATKLHDISFMHNLLDLKEITFNTCKKIANISALEYCRNLAKLSINNCGAIDGVSSLLKLDKLISVVILNTKVSDMSAQAIENLITAKRSEVIFKKG